MFYRYVGAGFEYTSGPASPVGSVQLDGFTFISALRWNPGRQEFLLTGTTAGRRLPDLSTGEKGDLRLYRRGVGDTDWTELSSTYSHDPVHSPQLGYAVHNGRGVSFLDEDGRLTRETKVGRFGWGPPALSIGPGGRALAWTRWKGDHAKPRIERLEGDRTECRASVARYAWFADDVLLARNGALPFLLDLGSGRTTAFARTIRLDLLDAHSTPADHRELLALSNGDVWQWAGDLAVHDGRVYFDLCVAEQRPNGRRFDGLVSVAHDGSEPDVHAVLGPDERFEGFAVRAEGITFGVATYENLRVVARRVDHVGPAAAFLAEGWVPAPSSSEPAFGSHVPLSTVGS